MKIEVKKFWILSWAFEFRILHFKFSLEDFIKNQKPDIRYLFDLREVIFDQKWLKTVPNLELYYMYRGVARSENDKQKIAAAGLRYDITIIPARMLGCEFVKTAGHEHSLVPGQTITYSEIYEVLSGQAYYLMQHYNHRNGRKSVQSENLPLRDVYVVKAETGDKVIIPPNYGHVTINAGQKDLVMANWVAEGFQSDYELFRQKHGACYLALAHCRGLIYQAPGRDKSSPYKTSINWHPNKNYGPLPKLRFSQPTNFPELGLDKNKPMYDLVSGNLSFLDFLKNPQDFKSLWQKILGNKKFRITRPRDS